MATFTIGVGTTAFDGTAQGAVAGDIIYVTTSAGRDHLGFTNVNGGAGNPITIVNQGGKVVFDVDATNRSYCVEFEDCDYVVFRGDGHADEWGFKCIGYANAGVRAWKQTEHIEIHNIEIGAYDGASSTGAALRAGTNIEDASPGWIMDEVHIHHCYLHDSKSEAMYIGKDLATDMFPIDDLIVEYCIIIDCGTSGPQIRNAINVQCQRNWIIGCGIDVDGSHAGGGLNIGDGTIDPMSGHWRYNYIKDCERGIHQLTHDDAVQIHHNLIVDCGNEGGIHGLQDGYKPQNNVDAGFKFYKNTIVDSGEYGIDTPGGDTNGEVEDCIVCGSGTADISTDWTEDSNVEGATAAQDFRASDIWYHLTASSPAVGAAHDGSDCGWVDYN